MLYPFNVFLHCTSFVGERLSFIRTMVDFERKALQKKNIRELNRKAQQNIWDTSAACR